MGLVLFAVLFVAQSLAWQPGQRDECNPVNVQGGSLILPHEKYCQLFYKCSEQGKHYEYICPHTLVFAYGVSTATCAYPGFPSTCPKWQCNVNDIGRNYPDVCCSKYWQCVASGVFEQRTCGDGTQFDYVSEQCSTYSSCSSHKHCIENKPEPVPEPEPYVCYHFPSASGNPCEYKTKGVKEDRPCPRGTSFSAATCQCSIHNSSCLMDNTFIDASCQASGRLIFDKNGLTTRSDKLNIDIRQAYYLSPGFTTNGVEGIFNAVQDASFIYNHFYNDKPLQAPLAIAVTFSMDSSLNINDEVAVLENRWTTDPSTDLCNPPTIRIAVRYTGSTQGRRQYQVDVSATGMDGTTSRANGPILGNTNDYFRIVFKFSGRLDATVTNIDSGISSSLRSDNYDLGGSLRPNKCGFALGRGLSGRIKEFSVYEGCGNFNNL